ncbi:MAG TPA: NAD(P)-dependent alcohol dehydrogenase [Bacteroidales bacterium]|nr:NAD(P)-dependent alcohol dehydrogenase [Bacteroidales bacterium]HRX95564.1 NAD(P)-dependent alcohol dehydrogenase [Bacteroidales bacterium]
MKAIVAIKYGGPEVLQFREIEKPIPKPHEVLVKVFVASVTRADTMIRTGKPYIGRLIVGLTKPKHPVTGTGFAGVISQVGENVTKFKVGDKVFGETTTGFGTHAGYVAVNEDGVIASKPDFLTFQEAATLADGPLTSMNFLKNVAQLLPGQKILINGASGSLGTAAVQLAKQMGAEVTGVSSESNLDLVESLGADHVIDYNKVDFTNLLAQYDIIYDTVGKSSFSKSKKALKPGGAYISPVLKMGTMLQMLKTSMIGNKKAKFSATGILKETQLRELLNELLAIMAKSDFKTIIDREYPLEQTAEAHAYISKGHKKGNVIVTVDHLN